MPIVGEDFLFFSLKTTGSDNLCYSFDVQNTINLVNVSTDGLYLVFCLSGQSEVSGKPLPLTGKGSGRLGSGQKLQGRQSTARTEAQDAQLCCYGSPGRRAGCWVYPGYSWDTYKGKRNTAAVFL